MQRSPENKRIGLPQVLVGSRVVRSEEKYITGSNANGSTCKVKRAKASGRGGLAG